MALTKVDPVHGVDLADKEYFHVDLTTDQSATDNTATVVDFGGKGTVVYDTKSNFDSANDAYLLGSNGGLYLINFNIGIANETITDERMVYTRGGIEIATDGSTYVALKGSGKQLRDSASDNGGSVVLSGTFIYKTTNATTKIRINTHTDSVGIGSIICATVSQLTQSTTALTDARPTWLSIVRIA
jgi:hypothetical protein|tara:strand:- start:251 stop:808 length:558 start_codon:yes stop_codon:yes gene_type:complete